jgi:hypothetical protein
MKPVRTEGPNDGYSSDDDIADDAGGDCHVQSQSTSTPSSLAVQATIKQKIAQLNFEIKEMEIKMKPLLAEREVISDKVTKGRSLLARLKKSLTKFRSDRKRSKDGMESKMLRVLKSIGVELTRYHGGSLNGMDIKKVIANSAYVFDEFATILKEHKRPGCKLSDMDIDFICEQHKLCLLLWDGAFSAARSINPTDRDFRLYEQFVKAAVYCHMRLGCSVTHKVHLMLCHAADQMQIPGGLGEKMEDWVELMHQIGNRARVRFRTTKDLEARAKARARTAHRAANTGVMARIAEIADEFARKKDPLALAVGLEDERRAIRERRRFDALIHHIARKRAERIVTRFLKEKALPQKSSADAPLV